MTLVEKHKEDQETEISVEVVHTAPNKAVCEGKAELSKGKGKLRS